MALRALTVALVVSVAISTASTAQPDSGPIVNPGPPPVTPAPPGTPSTRYCMKVDLTGNVAQPVKCWTRDEWAEQGVDVDREWAKEGVAILA